MNRNKWALALVVFGLLILALVIFWPVVQSGRVLMTTDDGIGELAVRSAWFPEAFRAGWMDTALLGFPILLPPNWTNGLLWLLPPVMFANWSHALGLFAASLFLYGFLRRRGVGAAAALLGILCAFWVGSNLTLTYAGHIAKYGTLVFASMTLWLLDVALARRSWSAALLAGLAWGGMFMEQQDLALFFSLAWGSYLLFRIFTESGWKMTGRISWLAALALAFFAVAAPPTYKIWKANAPADPGISESRQAKWDFSTQWSWPPEECIDFIAPGYMGWRSGEPAGPYWGRMGRSAGWESTGQGFMNFKLENQYLGVIPILLALLALAAAKRSRRRAEIWFWGAASGLTLLLAFGKYFPLYSLFYQLPGISSIRNPNKFLQVFQLALGILGAYGADEALRSAPAGSARNNGDPAPVTGPMGWFFRGALGLGGVLLLVALVQRLGMDPSSFELAQLGWKDFGRVIVGNKIVALFHGGGLALLAAGFFWLCLRARHPPTLRLAAAALVLVVAADAWWLSRNYVQTMPMSALAENAVTAILKKEHPDQRVALVSQDGFYNWWLTYLFPYHDIRALNVTQMPRMPEDYRRFLGALGNRPDRLWPLCAVQNVLTPVEGWRQMQQAGWTNWLKPVLAYDVTPAEAGVSVIPAASGRHLVLALQTPAPRYALFPQWEIMGDEDALRQLASASTPLFARVRVAPDTAEDLPRPAIGAPSGMVGTVTREGYKSGRVRLGVSAPCPVMLRFAERFDPGWTVKVDGHFARLRRVDFIFQGVQLAAGQHSVEFRYAPHDPLASLQWLAPGLLILGLAGLLFGRRKGPA